MRATDAKAAETLSLPKCITNIGASQGLPGLAGHLRGRGALAELSKELHNCNVSQAAEIIMGCLIPGVWDVSWPNGLGMKQLGMDFRD